MNCCIISGDPVFDVHHLVHRGAFGSDHENNLLKLRRGLHQRLHSIGLARFAIEYPVVAYWLTAHGWLLEGGRWIAPSECRKISKKTVTSFPRRYGKNST